jgi:hypothetical protein
MSEERLCQFSDLPWHQMAIALHHVTLHGWKVIPESPAGHRRVETKLASIIVGRR